MGEIRPVAEIGEGMPEAELDPGRRAEIEGVMRGKV